PHVTPANCIARDGRSRTPLSTSAAGNTDVSRKTAVRQKHASRRFSLIAASPRIARGARYHSGTRARWRHAATHSPAPISHPSQKAGGILYIGSQSLIIGRVAPTGGDRELPTPTP